MSDSSRAIYPIDASITLTDAATQWIGEHQRNLMPNTVRNYKQCIRFLVANIGNLLLKDIRIEDIRQYQVVRSQVAVPSVINQELCNLQTILKQAGEWTRLREFYKPLPVPRRGAGHSLTQEEEKLLRETAFSRPKWRLAAHSMVIMLSTTMGFGELRQLRRKDVNTVKGSLTVREGAKNLFRDRTIPLNPEALNSMTWILERWKKLGGCDPEHYILPHGRGRLAAHGFLTNP